MRVCVLGSVDHKVDTRDCACFWSGIISQATGRLEHTLSSWEDSGSFRRAGTLGLASYLQLRVV